MRFIILGHFDGEAGKEGHHPSLRVFRRELVYGETCFIAANERKSWHKSMYHQYTVLGDASEFDAEPLGDDLSRDVYCVLGLAIDATDMSNVQRKIIAASRQSKPYVMSTPNLNFLVMTLADREFRESLLFSNLCLPDGMPIVWIARLMGIPIRRRIAGSDVFAVLQEKNREADALGIFLFGATDRVTSAAARALNERKTAIECLGWICPGFGTIDELSQAQFFSEINSSGAKFLVVALNARKGQLWLYRNHHALRVPVRAQLGATIHFEAGSVKRAPGVLQKCGLEWFWRITQEPKLWSRYFKDGIVFLWLVLSRILPLALNARSLRQKTRRGGRNLLLAQLETKDAIILRLDGYATVEGIKEAITLFRAALAKGKPLEVDLSNTLGMDPRFMGLLLMLRTQMWRSGRRGPRFSGVKAQLQLLFRRNGLEYLLDEGDGC